MTGVAARRTPDERRLLGDMLLEAGLVRRDGLRSALQAQGQGGGRLGWHLMRLGSVLPASFHLFLDQHLEVMRPDLAEALRDGRAADRIPASLAHHYGVMPVREIDGRTLEVAVATADEPRLRPAIETLTGLAVEPIICPPASIGQALARHYPAEVEPGVVYRPAGDHLLVLSDPRRGLFAAPLADLGAGAPSSVWLRSVAREALDRGARRLAIEPQAGRLDLVLTVAEGDRVPLGAPRGAYAGLASLVEGLARIASRGRILPREGRFSLEQRGRRVVVSVLALPGLQGRSYVLDLREEHVVGPSPDALAAGLSGLPEAVQDLVAAGRGLLVIAAPGPSEWASALGALLALLGDRLPRRAVRGAWDGPAGGGSLLEPEVDLLVEASPWREGDGPAIGAGAGERVVVATVDAADAFTAAEVIARRIWGPSARTASPLGVLAVRHLETVCPSCRTVWDSPVLPARGRGDPIGAGPCWISPGCPACRGSGRLEVERVGEFLPLPPGELSRPGMSARLLRERHARRGGATIASRALEGAANGRIDVREVLRLLLHEPH